MKELSPSTRVYILAVIFIGGVLGVWQFRALNPTNIWLFVLAALASITQILKVEGPTDRSSYNISWLVYGFTLVLYGTPEALFVILVSHLVEWVWHKYPWYIQGFNIAMFAVTVSVAGWGYTRLSPGEAPFSLMGALAIVTSMAIFTLLNHLMVGLVLRLARGETFSESGVFGLLTLAIDFSLLCMGAVAALAWMVNPFASLLIIAPLYLIYSTLKVPALQRQTETDSKTGLFNARYFSRALEQELARADRFDRPMTVVLGDLDLLRNINNTYGHLAGDQVLIGIAKILQDSVRDYDIISRFGGEEFSILMPETRAVDAYGRIELIRQSIEQAEFEVETSVIPIQATISFGIAERNKFGQTSSDLLHSADVALYHAKLNGRNLTSIYSGEELEQLFQPDPTPEQPIRLSDLTDSMEGPRTNGKPVSSAPDSSYLTPAIGESVTSSRTVPTSVLNSFIVILMVVAAGLFWINYQSYNATDWLTLAGFALIVLALEGLAIDIYVRDTSISTSTAPFLAGVLLTGPVGALVLSVVLAGTSLVKRGSPFKHFLFNVSNHMISSLLCLSLISVAGIHYLDHMLVVQFGLAIISAGIIYVVSTCLLAMVIKLSTGASFRQVWSERFRWLSVYYFAFGLLAFVLILSFEYGGMIGALIVTTPLFILRYSQTQYIEHTKSLVKEVRSKNAALNHRAEEISELNEELFRVLSMVADLKDPYHKGHTRLVTSLAIQIAEQMNLPLSRIALVRKAGLLHDIGQVGIPESILAKDAPLSTEEYSAVMRHVHVGADIVQDSNLLKALTAIIRHHHEWFDGSGYPDGLIGHAIPLEARILAVADAFAAMLSDRPYRKAKPFFEIVGEFHKHSGTQFDPIVVEALFEILDRDGIESLFALIYAKRWLTPKPDLSNSKPAPEFMGSIFSLIYCAD